MTVRVLMLSAVAFATLVACRGDEPRVVQWTAPTPPERDDPRVACPPGTKQRREGPDFGETIYCVDGAGIKEGPFRQWYANGQLAEEMSYRQGAPDGPANGWYESGAREFEWVYRDGKHHGRQRTWYENGKLVAEAEYRDGVVVGTPHRWDERGRPERVTAKTFEER